MNQKIPKRIIDKNGKETTVYVNPDAAHIDKRTANVGALPQKATNDLTSGYVAPSGKVWKLAPQNAPSGMACPDCGEFFPEKAGYLIDTAFRCEGCDSDVYGPFEYDIHIEPKSQRFLDPDIVKSESWYHITYMERWHDDVLSTGEGTRGNQVLVHLGTLDAAMMRGQHLAKHMGGSARDIFCHEVKLSPKTKVSEEIAKDDNDLAPTTINEAKNEPDYEGNGVTRYVNEYEQPGSISLLANPQMFTVVDTFLIHL